MCQHCKLNHEGLKDSTQPSIQRLGHRGSHIVYRSDTEIIPDSSGLPFFAIEDVFLDHTSVLIGFGMPNVFTAVYRADDDPKGPGWDKFAAFMFWRQGAVVANTKGRLQAGIFMELRGLPKEARDSIRREMKQLSGKRNASCARLNAKMLHRAGFTLGNDHSLRTFVRPTKFVSLLWRYHGLKYKGENVDARIVVTDGKGIGDHIEGMHENSVWGREARSAGRMIEKIYAKEQPHVPAPLFQAKESTMIDPSRWSGRQTTVGINRPRWLGVKLAFLVGQQPVYTVGLDHIDQVDELQKPLQPFPGKLDRITKIKKHVLFSRPVIGTIRHFRMKMIEYYDSIPARAAADMLIRSDGPDHDTAVLYNCVVTLTGDDTAEARITGLKNQDERSQQSRWVRTINWLLAKHVLISGYDPKTVYACEMWTYLSDDGEPVLCLNNNSGTYKPDLDRLHALANYLENLFGIRVETSRMEDELAQSA